MYIYIVTYEICPIWVMSETYEWVLAHLCFSFMQELHHSNKWVLSRMCRSVSKHVNDSNHLYEGVTSNKWMSPVAYIKELRYTHHIYPWVISHTWNKCCHMYESYHTYSWVTTHTYSHITHTSHITHIHGSRHTHIVISHIWHTHIVISHTWVISHIFMVTWCHTSERDTLHEWIRHTTHMPCNRCFLSQQRTKELQQSTILLQHSTTPLQHSTTDLILRPTSPPMSLLC